MFIQIYKHMCIYYARVTLASFNQVERVIWIELYTG